MGPNKLIGILQQINIKQLTYFFLCSTVSSLAARPKSPSRNSMFSLMKKFPERDKSICPVSIPQMTRMLVQSHRFLGCFVYALSRIFNHVPSLRSLCRIPLLWRYLRPDMICLR